MRTHHYRLIVIGGGHAGVEAAWAAANLLPEPGSVALVTLDPSKIGVMSCNPAIGGLAKGQLVREVDALGGLMGLATDATGIMFKMLNTSKGPAVHGPRAQCDKHAYAHAVQALIESRHEIDVLHGAVEAIRVQRHAGADRPRIVGVDVRTPEGERRLDAQHVVLTTGTFMRGLMHSGLERTPGGRAGEAPANPISNALAELGFERGRLRTGTPPRLRRGSIEWESLPEQLGDADPRPFSDLTPNGWNAGTINLDRFPLLPQVACRQTATTPDAHATIRKNLHRAPMFSGQIESAGPRYCPSIEDKVHRFADRESHGVFLEPESLGDEWVYCNGIATSLPHDVQDEIVHTMAGCAQAEILQYGYAVEYDMVRPHQILATGETKLVEGLFLAGQINGTSGYEEAAAQGLVAGVNAARAVLGSGGWVLGRDQAYIGVLMDDLITKTPVEPYRMFTSRAEHRLLLRADNAADRLTPVATALGLLETPLGARRREVFMARRGALGRLDRTIDEAVVDGEPLAKRLRRTDYTVGDLAHETGEQDLAAVRTAWADRRYEAYITRQRAEVRRHAEMERRAIPAWFEPVESSGLRNETIAALRRFRPATFGQASRLEGVTPADLTLLAVLVRKGREPAARG